MEFINMLSTELITFQNDLNNLLKDSSYKAAKEAFIRSLEVTNKKDIPIDNNGDLNISYENIKEKTADEFGKTFSDTFSKELSTDLAKLIMNYIKSANINIIYTPTTLASPVGPVTGALTISPATASIEIL